MLYRIISKVEYEAVERLFFLFFWGPKQDDVKVINLSARQNSGVAYSAVVV